MPLSITTQSVENVDQWRTVYPNGIYPAFVDNLDYWTWLTPHENGFRTGFQMVGTGATGLKWRIIAGALPDGLTMSESGFITGKPTRIGTYSFTVELSAPGQTTVTKNLKMVADPPRGKFIRDARTFITTHWGKMSGGHPDYPLGIKNTLDATKLNGVDTHIPEFEALTTNVNAVAQCNQFEQWGMDLRESSYKWQNHSPLWPSNAATRYLDHSNRNFAGEEVTAFHAAGKRVITYFAPDSFYYGVPPQKLCDGDFPYGNWADVNHVHIDELFWTIKVDGIIFDVGGTYEIPGVNAGYMYRPRVIGIIRNRNPWAPLGFNPGTRDHGIRQGGALIAYPHCDFVIFETVKSTSTSESQLEYGVPSMSEKEMYIIAWNQISTSWGFGPNSLTDPIKNTPGIINNMRKNVNRGITCAQALPVPLTTVPFVAPVFQATFDAIGAEHKATKDFSEDVKFTLNGSNLEMSTVNPSEIYYTTDGSEPTVKSKLYFQPIPVTKNLKVRARSLQKGKSQGFMSHYQVQPYQVKPVQKTLLPAPIAGTPATDAKKQYVGFWVTVGRSPLLLKGIGREIVGSMIDNHKFAVRRRWDEYPIIWDTIRPSDVERGGFKYGRVPDIRLEPGMSYIIGVQEGIIDQFRGNAITSPPPMSDLEIRGRFLMSEFGDLFPVTDYGIGQYLNLEYEVLHTERSANLALGALGSFTGSNSDAVLDTNATVKFADNAFNGDRVESSAVFGGVLTGKVNGNMRIPQEFNTCELYFGEAIPPSFDILVSPDGKHANTRVVASVSGNSSAIVKVNFVNTVAQFVHLRNTSGTMIVNSFEVYKY